MKIQLPPEIVALHRFCARRDANPNLECVRIEPYDGGAVAVATDGRLMAVVRFDADVRDTVGFGIRSEALALVPAGREAWLEGGAITWTTEWGGGVMVSGAKVVAERLGWRVEHESALVPGDSAWPLCFGARYLEAVARYLEGCGGSGVVRFVSHGKDGELSPARIVPWERFLSHIEFSLMPVRP